MQKWSVDTRRRDGVFVDVPRIVVGRRFIALNAQFPLTARQRLVRHGVAAARQEAGGWRRRRRRSGGGAVAAREVLVMCRVGGATTKHYVNVFAPLLLLPLQQPVVLWPACKPYTTAHTSINLPLTMLIQAVYIYNNNNNNNDTLPVDLPDL